MSQKLFPLSFRRSLSFVVLFFPCSFFFSLFFFFGLSFFLACLVLRVLLYSSCLVFCPSEVGVWVCVCGFSRFSFLFFPFSFFVCFFVFSFFSLEGRKEG